jgi:hypothetical protein
MNYSNAHRKSFEDDSCLQHLQLLFFIIFVNRKFLDAIEDQTIFNRLSELSNITKRL